MALYYDDLAAMDSSFCTLVDLAVMLYEQEHPKCNNTKKTLSEEEEKRIFLLVPRKSRNKFVTRRRRNLTFSSILDLNTIHLASNPRNLLQWPSSPSSSSSSSSLLLEDSKTKTLKESPSFSTLLVGYKTDDSEEMEMTNSPPNPNSPSNTPPNPNSPSSPSSCITENTRRSRKRRAEKQRSNGKSKKAKVALSFTYIGKEKPNWLVQLMEAMDGTDLKLIFERDLYKTDVEPGESRLSMPSNHLIRNDFLTPIESRIIEEDINNDNKIGVGAILVDQMFRKYGVMLKRWEMKKDTGRGSWNYSLTCGWNDVVKANRLKKDDYVSVWSFRSRQVLCFALVPAPSSSLALSL